MSSFCSPNFVKLMIGSASLCYYLPRMHACAKSLQSCPTLCDPMDCSLPGSSVHGILQERILEWVATSFSTKWGLMASTSLGQEGAQERQRLLQFLTQVLVPRKFSTHSIDIYNCYVFILDRSLDHYVVFFLISCNILYFKVYFV